MWDWSDSPKLVMCINTESQCYSIVIVLGFRADEIVLKFIITICIWNTHWHTEGKEQNFLCRMIREASSLSSWKYLIQPSKNQNDRWVVITFCHIFVSIVEWGWYHDRTIYMEIVMKSDGALVIWFPTVKFNTRLKICISCASLSRTDLTGHCNHMYFV